VLYWHADSGVVSRVDDAEQPFVRALIPILRETRDVASLDATLLDIVEKLTGGRPDRRR
jgi:hypothetical protein